MKKIFKLFILIPFTAVIIFISNDAYAQCAMCKATVESNMKDQGKNLGGLNESTNGNKIGMGLNKGILYLLCIPYALGAVGIGIWLRNRKYYKTQ